MADLSSFSNNEFKATSWINSIIEDIPEGENLESYVTAISMKLHIAAQDYSEQLETAMVESISTMPRIVSEINRLEDQLKSVQSEMQSISNHIHAVDKTSLSGVEELSRLDHLKFNMEKSKSTLEEHARWSQLVREAKNLLDNGDMLSETADCIQVMSKSLDILKKLPGNDERVATFDSFRTQLLESVRPNLRNDIQSFNVSSLQEYLYVFRKLNSESYFESEYTASRPEKITDYWKSYILRSKDPLSQRLAMYLGNVVKFIAEEEEHLEELFASHRLESVICLESLKPLKQDLCTLLKDDNTIQVTFDCYTVVDEFSKRMVGMMSKFTELERLQILDSLFYAIYQHLPLYCDSEEKFLKEQIVVLLNAFSFQTRDASLSEEDFGEWHDPLEQISNLVHGLLEVVETFPSLCNESFTRTMQYMGGLSIRQSMKILSVVLLLFIKQLQLKIANFATSIGLETESSSSSLSTSSIAEQLDKPLAISDRYSSYSEEIKQANKLAVEISTADHDKQTIIGYALRVLQSMGRFSKSIQSLEVASKSACAELQRNLLVESKFPMDIESWGRKENSIAAAYGLYLLNKDINQIAELKSFLANNIGLTAAYSQGAFSTVNKSLRKTIERSGDIIIRLSIHHPNKLLSSYANEDCWNKQVSNQELSNLGDNLLPQSIVTQVGEHLLSWVQDLESFASSDAFADLQSLRVDPVQLVKSSVGWMSLKASMEIVDEKAIEQLAERSTCCKMIKVLQKEIMQWSRAHGTKLTALGTHEDIMVEDEAVDVDANNEHGQVIIFVNEWLSMISDAIVGLLLSQIFKISEISSFGSYQLVSDIDYLSNVIHALGIKPHPLLLFMKLLLQENVQVLSNCLQMLSTGKSLGALKDILKFAMSITLIRRGQ